jgi:predicted HAD superfamily Cof-like phosphohydrolase
MANRKFAALANLKPAESEQPSPEKSLTVHREPKVSENKARSLGKRSDPNFKSTTVFIHQSTKKAANRLLEDKESTQDLSDLINQLLAEWVQENTASNM